MFWRAAPAVSRGGTAWASKVSCLAINPKRGNSVSGVCDGIGLRQLTHLSPCLACLQQWTSDISANVPSPEQHQARRPHRMPQRHISLCSSLAAPLPPVTIWHDLSLVGKCGTAGCAPSLSHPGDIAPWAGVAFVLCPCWKCSSQVFVVGIVRVFL